jgi:hypothetical protein
VAIDLRALRGSGEHLLPSVPLESELSLLPLIYGRPGRRLRQIFDLALSKIHYAGKCQRVGRCMRLAVVTADHQWVGGIVLGSTFPNIHVRDSALGLKPYVRDTPRRGLRSPWSSENKEYWERLQTVVNHARTFIFPEFQGRGIGVQSHRQLLTQGISRWQERYPGQVTGLDTLCDSADSGLFRRNGWDYVGTTTGYKADRSRVFVPTEGTNRRLCNNVALTRSGRQWEVWVRKL